MSFDLELLNKHIEKALENGFTKYFDDCWVLKSKNLIDGVYDLYSYFFEDDYYVICSNYSIEKSNKGVDRAMQYTGSILIDYDSTNKKKQVLDVYDPKLFTVYTGQDLTPERKTQNWINGVVVQFINYNDFFKDMNVNYDRLLYKFRTFDSECPKCKNNCQKLKIHIINSIPIENIDDINECKELIICPKCEQAHLISCDSQ